MNEEQIELKFIKIAEKLNDIEFGNSKKCFELIHEYKVVNNKTNWDELSNSIRIKYGHLLHEKFQKTISWEEYVKFKTIQYNLNNLCGYSNLKKHKNLLLKILEVISGEGCEIKIIYDSPKSSHLYKYDIGKSSIHLSLKKDVYKNDLDVIWTLLHEFGHHFRPLKLEDKDNIIKIIESEIFAWKWVKENFERFEELKDKKTLILKCENDYLLTYYYKLYFLISKGVIDFKKFENENLSKWFHEFKKDFS